MSYYFHKRQGQFVTCFTECATPPLITRAGVGSECVLTGPMNTFVGQT